MAPARLGATRLGSLSLLTLSSLLALAAAGTATAQVSPATGPTRDDLDPVPVQKEAPRSRLSVEGDVEKAPCALEDPAYAGIKVDLKTVIFNNLGPVAAEDLAESYAGLLGEQPVSAICRIRDAAATKLRALGYVAAVQVPTQRIEGNRVSFEILYAKVTSVRLVGAAGRNEQLIESYLSQLVDGKVFNRFEAERHLLLARDIPGYSVRLALKPAGSGAGNMIAEVTLTRTPFTFDVSAQNYGDRSTGRIGGQARAIFNGVTGMGDRTTLGFYTTGDFQEQRIYQFGHEMLLGGDGLKLGARATYALTRPDLGAAIADIRARTLYTNFEASYPLIRRQALTLRAAAGFDLVNQKVEFAGAPLSEDRLRVGYGRLDFDAIDLKGVGPSGSVGWRAGGSIEVRKGFKGLGASPNCLSAAAPCLIPGFVAPSLPDGDPGATVIRAIANIDVRVLDGVTFGFSPRAQVSSAGLFSFEQFSTGNYTIGRGYGPGAIVGDKGLGYQSELRFDAFRLKPGSRVDFAPYAFSDNALVWDRAAATRPQKLNSAGGGLRIGFAGRARLDLTAAVPLTTLPGETKKRSPRLLASFSMNILPWSNR